MRALVLVLAALLTAGTADAKCDHASCDHASTDAHAAHYCRSIGAAPGTRAYARCTLALRQQRATAMIDYLILELAPPPF
jgi:hypothetical protein